LVARGGNSRQRSKPSFTPINSPVRNAIGAGHPIETFQICRANAADAKSYNRVIAQATFSKVGEVVGVEPSVGHFPNPCATSPLRSRRAERKVRGLTCALPE